MIRVLKRRIYESTVQMPNLPPELLSILRCPVTGSTLNQDGDELVTATGGHNGEPLRYSINDGIPVLLPAGEQAPHTTTD